MRAPALLHNLVPGLELPPDRLVCNQRPIIDAKVEQTILIRQQGRQVGRLTSFGRGRDDRSPESSAKFHTKQQG